MDEPIEIEFSFERDEYIRGIRFRNLKLTGVIHPLFLLMYLFGTIYLGGGSEDIRRNIIVTLLVGLYFGFLMYFRTPKMKWKEATFNDRIALNIYWKFTESGVRYETDDVRGDYSWNMFGDLKENKEFFLLVYTAKYGGSVFLPKRAFQSVDEQDAFSNLVFDKIKYPQGKALRKN